MCETHSKQQVPLLLEAVARNEAATPRINTGTRSRASPLGKNARQRKPSQAPEGPRRGRSQSLPSLAAESTFTNLPQVHTAFRRLPASLLQVPFTHSDISEMSSMHQVMRALSDSAVLTTPTPCSRLLRHERIKTHTG